MRSKDSVNSSHLAGSSSDLTDSGLISLNTRHHIVVSIIMDYFLRHMSSRDAHAVVHWRYPGEYAFYSMDADPKDLQEFLDFERWKPDTKFAVSHTVSDKTWEAADSVLIVTP